MTDSTKTPTAAALIVGNEVLSGRTQDSNLNAIAKKMFSLGIKLAEARVVADIESEIVEAVNALRGRYTYVFTTGGIGPTHDDITAASVAKAFGMPLVESPEARARLVAYYTESKLNPARLLMAKIPAGASLIDNSVSAAPGFRMDNVHVLAGVPDIMKAMLDVVATGLQKGPAIKVATINCAVPESILADELAAIATNYPQLDIGSYPSFRVGQIGLTLVVRGTDLTAVRAATEAISTLVVKYDGQPVVEAAT